jgi:L-fuconolactonase
MSGPAGPAGPAGIVDAHQHVWDLAAHAQPWLELPGHEPLLRNYSEADLRPLAAAAGVTATVVVQTVTEATETPELLAIAAASELISGVVGWTDLQAPGVADALAALLAEPGGDMLSGIRHPVLIETDPDWLTRSARRASATTSWYRRACCRRPPTRPRPVPASRSCSTISATRT